MPANAQPSPRPVVDDDRELTDEEIELFAAHQAEMLRLKLRQEREQIRLRKKLKRK